MPKVLSIYYLISLIYPNIKTRKFLYTGNLLKIINCDKLVTMGEKRDSNWKEISPLSVLHFYNTGIESERLIETSTACSDESPASAPLSSERKQMQ